MVWTLAELCVVSVTLGHGSPATGGLGLTALPPGTNFAGAVNFAHQADPVVEDARSRLSARRPVQQQKFADGAR